MWLLAHFITAILLSVFLLAMALGWVARAVGWIRSDRDYRWGTVLPAFLLAGLVIALSACDAALWAKIKRNANFRPTVLGYL